MAMYAFVIKDVPQMVTLRESNGVTPTNAELDVLGESIAEMKTAKGMPMVYTPWDKTVRNYADGTPYGYVAEVVEDGYTLYAV